MGAGRGKRDRYYTCVAYISHVPPSNVLRHVHAIVFVTRVRVGLLMQVKFILEGTPFVLQPPNPATGLPLEELPLQPLLRVLSVDNLLLLFLAGERARACMRMCCVPYVAVRAAQVLCGCCSCGTHLSPCAFLLAVGVHVCVHVRACICICARSCAPVLAELRANSRMESAPRWGMRLVWGLLNIQHPPSSKPHCLHLYLDTRLFALTCASALFWWVPACSAAGASRAAAGIQPAPADAGSGGRPAAHVPLPLPAHLHPCHAISADGLRGGEWAHLHPCLALSAGGLRGGEWVNSGHGQQTTGQGTTVGSRAWITRGTGSWSAPLLVGSGKVDKALGWRKEVRKERRDGRRGGW